MKIAEFLTQLFRTFVEDFLFYRPLAWMKPDEVDSFLKEEVRSFGEP
jgi:hypothetical protein